MRSVTVRLDDLRTTIINLGFVGENEHRQIRFDAKKDFEEYPNASASLTVVPPEGESYPAIIERDGDFVLWTITDSDVIGEGDGEIQLAFTEGEIVKRTCIGRTKTDRSLVPTGNIPAGIDDFITRAGTLLEQVEETFPAGGTTGQVLAKKSDTDYDTEWVDQGGGTEDYDELENRPQIGGVTLTGNKTLHDLGAASEGDVDAKYTKPEGGIPASDIADGVIQDPEDLIDDTAGEGDTDKVWSADKSSSLLTEITNKMDEPSAEGSNGQVLTTNGSGGRSWQNPPAPSDAQVATAVSSWIDAHPEAVTTVQDGAVTEPKLAESLKHRIMTFVPLNGWSTVNYGSGYIGASGNVGSNASFRHTDFIPVSEGDEIAYNLSGYETTIYIVTGYNSSKEKVTGADVVGKTGFKSGTYTVPSGVAYVRLSSGSYSDANLYFRSATVLGTNPQNTQTYVDNADNALSARITVNANALEELDGVQSVKNFYTMSPNMFDPSKKTPYGGAFYWTNYMPVIPGERYTGWTNNVLYTLNWYNSEKTQLEESVINAVAFERIAPANAAFARMSYKDENGTIAMFAKGIVGDYVPYGVFIPIEELPAYVIRDSNNIYDPRKFARGLNISTSTGVAYAYSNDTCVTDFIPVEEGKTYYFGGEGDEYLNITGSGAYDDSYGFVSSITNPFTVPSGVAFIRLGYSYGGVYARICVREGQTGISGMQSYDPYDTFRIINTKPTGYERANGLYGLKWNVMGDSITAGSGTTKSYAGFIRERTGILTNGYGVSDTAIARRGPDDVYAMCDRYADMDNDADIVTVFGGTNDHGNSISIGEWGDSGKTTLYGAMKILCEGLIGKYMGKKIGFILPLPKYVNSTDYSYPNESFGAYIECIKDVCKRYSIPYLDLYTECGFAPKIEAVRTAMIPDGLHPNATGHELISWQIQRFLERL